MKFYFQDEGYILDRFRFFFATGARWFQFGHYFWKTSMHAKTLAELEVAIRDFNDKYENKMYDRINII